MERLVLAGTAPEAEFSALVKEAGLDAVVRILLDEVLFRCDEPVNRTPVHIALDLTHDGAHRRVVLRLVRDEPISVVDDESVPVQRELRMAAVDLVRRLFGPMGPPKVGDFHDTFLPARPDDLRDLTELVLATNQASGTLLSGCTTPHLDLGRLSLAYGSDKWASFHWYTAHYEEQFARYRDLPVRVLEIGIGGFDGELGGGSLQMWKRYFHRGLIYGLDLFDKSALNRPRLTALIGDQADAGALRAIAERYGPFDIVIDDGSHDNAHVRISFETLFPYVRSGGVYVIEDMQTAYIPRFGGSAGIRRRAGHVDRAAEGAPGRHPLPGTGARSRDAADPHPGTGGQRPRVPKHRVHREGRERRHRLPGLDGRRGLGGSRGDPTGPGRASGPAEGRTT